MLVEYAILIHGPSMVLWVTPSLVSRMSLFTSSFLLLVLLLLLLLLRHFRPSPSLSPMRYDSISVAFAFTLSLLLFLLHVSIYSLSLSLLLFLSLSPFLFSCLSYINRGHEAAGEVDVVGEGVTRLKKGDRVGLGWFGGFCGSCNSTYNLSFSLLITSLSLFLAPLFLSLCITSLHPLRYLCRL